MYSQSMWVYRNLSPFNFLMIVGWQDDMCVSEKGTFSEEFIKKMEEWERIKGISKFSELLRTIYLKLSLT